MLFIFKNGIAFLNSPGSHFKASLRVHFWGQHCGTEDKPLPATLAFHLSISLWTNHPRPIHLSADRLGEAVEDSPGAWAPACLFLGDLGEASGAWHSHGTLGQLRPFGQCTTG